MVGTPRIIFTRFSSPESRNYLSWAEHVRRVVHLAPPVLAAASPVIVWHLVSANNRELARGTGACSSFREAATAAEFVVDNIADAMVWPVSDEIRGQFGWYLTVADVPRAVSARWYSGNRERRQSGDLARVALAACTIALGTRGVHEFSHPDLVLP